MKHKKIEDAVLKVYRNVSPSYRKLENKRDFIKNLKQRKNILDELALPEMVFAGRKLLDIGGGTGENSIFYALWGADVTILEPNEISCGRAVELFKSFDLSAQIENLSLWDYDASKINKYDFVMCEGVLHHTYNPIEGLKKILSNLKTGALMMLAIAEYHGWFKRTLQRDFIRSISKSEEEIIQNSRKYFSEHISRAVKFGLRSEETVIHDTFVNPQIKPVKLKDICSCFLEQNMQFYSSYPVMGLFSSTFPWSQPRENKFNYSSYKKYYSLLESIWMTSGDENISDCIRNFSVKNIMDRIETQRPVLEKMKKKIAAKKRLTGMELALIQHGYMGIGMNYFAGIKLPECRETS